MSLVVLGTNHKSATLAMRERWSYGIDEVTTTLQKLKSNLNINDVMLLSTCNRTEVYCDIDNPERLINWFNQEIKPITDLDITQHGYYYLDKSAATHIMRVASGLDSLVVGEPQILGQFKQAYRLAKKANTISKKFDKLFSQTISAAKDVRTYTDIGLHPVSIASLSVNLLINNLKINYLNNFNNLKILLIGSGDTIQTIGRTLINKNFNNITITSRNYLHANDLAGNLRQATEDFSIINNIPKLAEYDVIFSATRSPVYILPYEIINKVINYKNNLNKINKLFLLDLAVPRDIDPECSNINQVFLYTIDDLQNILENNTAERKKSAVYAENIIARYIDEFYNWEQSLLALASICSYRQQAEEMCNDVIERAKRKLDAGQDPKEVLTSALELLRNKLIHHPTITLKNSNNLNEKIN